MSISSSRIIQVDSLALLSETITEVTDGRRVFFVADRNTAPIFERIFHRVADFVVPAGEACKSLEISGQIWDELLAKSLRKTDFVVSFGGGSVSDLTGFVASTYKRGAKLVHIPTSLLAMIDASIGGKTAIDFGGIKNSIGTFYPAEAVILAADLLETLPGEELVSGRGEMLKYALLLGRDPSEFLSPDHSKETIRDCLEYKREIVSEDPFDTGKRQALNLGHTVGHALEALHMSSSGAEVVRHGVAVAAGVVIESFYSFVLGHLSQAELMSLARTVSEEFPPIFFSCHDYDDLWSLALQDKKNSGTPSVVRASIPQEGPGHVLVGVPIERELWDEGLDFYKDFFRV